MASDVRVGDEKAGEAQQGASSGTHWGGAVNVENGREFRTKTTSVAQSSKVVLDASGAWVTIQKSAHRLRGARLAVAIARLPVATPKVPRLQHGSSSDVDAIYDTARAGSEAYITHARAGCSIGLLQVICALARRVHGTRVRQGSYV